jgi:transposase
VAHIAAARYAEHQPLYRQEQQLARTGVPLPRSTQVSLLEQLAAEVAPLTDLLRDAILQSGYVHLDATPLQVCDRTRPGRTREVALWAYRAGQSGLGPAGLGAVWYDYQPSKAIAAPQQVLTQAQFRGILQTDGAGGFDKLVALLAAQGATQGATATGPPAVTHLGCIAHLRRRVFKAVELKETGAAWYLERINRLYRIDRRIAEALAHSDRGRACTPAEREAWRDRVRLKVSAPLFDRLMARAEREVLTVPPKTLLGKALQYLLAQQGPLRRCLTTPGVKLDNNAVENAMRPPKLSERNVLFVGHPHAGPRLAVLTTLVENARQEGLDIEAYLVDVLTRLPTTAREDLPQLLPRAWREAHDAQRAVAVAAATAQPAA